MQAFDKQGQFIPQNRRRTLPLPYFRAGSGERYPKKVAGTQLSKNAEKAGLVKSLRKQFPLEMLLPLIGLKRSTFFYHLTDKVDTNADIEQKIAEIFHKNNGNYGYRRITLALRKIWTINHKKIQAIMQKLGLKGKCRRRKYRSYLGGSGQDCG